MIRIKHGRKISFFLAVTALLVGAGLILEPQFNGRGLGFWPREQSVILFLGWDKTGQVQLFRTTVKGEPEQLTQETAVILHYAPAPNGQQIAYTTGDAIWLMDADGRALHNMLTCPYPPCNQLVWHPDSRRLLYEQQNQLWWLDTTTGETVPLKQEMTRPSRAARFSADGEWVSYVVSPEEGIEFYNFKDGRHFQIASILGAPAIWHPTEPVFIYRDQRLITFHGSDDDNHQEHSHEYAQAEALYWATINDPSGILISGDNIVDDAPPAWSPDGEWIVFGRKQPRTPLGRQLWLARPDGSEAQPLTDEPLIHHGLPQWSGDGRTLLFQRYDTANPETRPAIWLLEIATGQQTNLVAAGFLPGWLP